MNDKVERAVDETFINFRFSDAYTVPFMFVRFIGYNVWTR